VKRMWTNPRYRRRGLATPVLRTLEEAAVESGYDRLILETGPLQPEAEELYGRSGYCRTEVYGLLPGCHRFQPRSFESLTRSESLPFRLETRHR
jgi:hypothetical protein